MGKRLIEWLTSPVVLTVGVVLLFFSFTGNVDSKESTDPATTVMTDSKKTELIYMLYHDCGSCHGMQLKGGLGPALNKEAMHGKSAEYLKLVISEGRPGTAMPPWKQILNEAEIEFLAEYLIHNEPVEQIAQQQLPK